MQQAQSNKLSYDKHTRLAADPAEHNDRRDALRFHLHVTGACQSGLEHGMAQAGIPKGTEEMPLADALAAMHGPFGDAFRRALA